MTIDARTASPEPPLHAATLLSRTRLTQRECAARLGISERQLRYHVAGRPMAYTVRLAFERLADECEDVRRLYGGRKTGKTAAFLHMSQLGGSENVPPRRFYPLKCPVDFSFEPSTDALRKALDALEQHTVDALTKQEMTPEARAELKAFITPPTWEGIDDGKPFDPTRYRK